jgi:hypothetical protein
MNRKLKDVLCTILTSISVAVLMFIVVLSISGLACAVYLLITGAIK